MEVYVVKPYGCCSGVLNAIALAKKVAKISKKQVYILGMLVHNESVVNSLSNLGIITLSSKEKTNYELIDSIKDGVMIFSAHGHDPKLDELALTKGLEIYDTTCVYVKKAHELIKKALDDNHQVIYIGKAKHPECESALSLGREVYLYDVDSSFNYDDISDKEPIIITQTTLSILEVEHIYEDIKNHIEGAKILQEVCSETRIRQSNLLQAPKDSDLILIIGSKNSSNTSKLFELAINNFKTADVQLIHSLEELQSMELNKYKKVVVAAGASTPKETVEEIIDYIKN